MPGDRTNRYENSGRDYWGDPYDGATHPDVGTPDDLADPVETDHYDAVNERDSGFSPNTTREQLLGGRWPNIGSGDV